MKPTFHTADFRRFLRRPLRREEINIAEALERQRHATGRVRAVINDPNQSLHRILLDYIRYIQHLNKRDCILMDGRRPASERAKLVKPLRTLSATPRSYLRIYGTVRPIGQVLLLNAHLYPKGRLNQILHITLPYANGPFSVVIIHGPIPPPSSVWLQITPLGAEVPKILFMCKPLAASSLRPQIIPNSQFLIPNHPSLIALPISSAPTKIPA